MNVLSSSPKKLATVFTVLTISVSAATAAEFVVDTTADNTIADSFTTLREAITAANATPGADTIIFSVNGTGTLFSPLPPITESLTITGNGRNFTGISGSNAHRIFFVDGAGVNFQISDLTLRNGFGLGGDGGTSGGSNDGGAGGGGLGAGGAIFLNNDSSATIFSVDFEDNSVVGGTGGTVSGSANPGAGGGGMQFDGADATSSNPGGGGDGPAPYSGSGGNTTSGNGGPGGFGGGGAGGDDGGTANNGGNGGFGGGGGGGGTSVGGGDGGNGGFGGGGGGGGSTTSGLGGSDGDRGLGGQFGGSGGTGSNFFRAGGGAGLGGAIFVHSSASLDLYNSSFTDNTSLGGAASGTGASGGSGRGAAIFAMSGSNVTVDTLTFSSNSSGNASGSGYTSGALSNTEDVYGTLNDGPFPPFVEISTVDAFTTVSTVANVTITFNEDVTGLDGSDFLTTGGVTVTNITGGPAVYSVDFDLFGGDGVKEVQLPAGVVDDLFVPPSANLASNVVSFSADITSPVSTVIDAYAQLQAPMTKLVIETTSSDSSGVADLDLYYRFESGTWTNSGITPSGDFFVFDTATYGGEGTYDFYTIATDVNGFVEDAPGTEDLSVGFVAISGVLEWQILND